MKNIIGKQLLTLEKDTVIGKYRIVEHVGSGGIGQVYKAINIKNGDVVALKKLHDHYQRDKKLLGLFHKEIMIHSRVSHRHCVSFIEADLTPGWAYIVTEFIDGYNCYNLVKQIGKVPPLIASSMVLDLLHGLEHLHCLDIIHSDLTPSNVLVSKHGLTLLADFGLSCLEEIEDYAGIILGTPGYQAPERLKHLSITPLSDIYGAGIILFELLTGERLFFGYTEAVLKERMKKIDYSWIDTGDKKLNAVLKEILQIALAIDPSDRFATPRDFMYALYQGLKIFDITHTRRATLQWLVDAGLSSAQPHPPMQRIYVDDICPYR